MNLVREIGRRLPEPIKSPITKLYQKWNQKWSTKVIVDKEMIEDLIDFYNMKFGYAEYKLSYDEAISLCKVAGRINADF